ncbi:MAG TPA: sulfotransferase [Pseudomonadales bacterium]
MKPTLQDALSQGARLLQARNAREANRLADVLVRQFPESTPVRLFAADAASLAGDVTAAIAHLDALPAAASRSGIAALKKARLLFADGRRAEALRLAREAADRCEGKLELLRMLASILRDCQQLEEAHHWLEEALRLAPGDPDVLYELALAEYHLNRPAEAEGHIASLLTKSPFHGSALHLRSALRTQTDADNHVEDLRRRLDEGPQHPRFVAAANYALAKELEDLGRYEESVAALDRGARAYRSTLTYDLEAELSAHEGIRSVFSRQAFEALAPGFAEERPVFVVGMPRTGTTLVERILAGHSHLVSIGEFTEFPRLYGIRLREQFARDPSRTSSEASLDIDFAALGRSYSRAARDLAGDARGFVDKLPFNFLYCGYILAALPNAKVIHLTRDPLDTCYAVYKTLFFGAYGFSYDLDELASYYISYRRQMAHWHSVLPGRILDVSYEALVREPEVQVRRMTDWCGLPWEPSVLDFHRRPGASMTASAMQVRQPMYTDSIGSWRRAEARFAPLKARLEAAGVS